MSLPFAQSIDPGVILVAVVMAALLITIMLLGLRGRHARKTARAAAEAAGVGELSTVDSVALLAAVDEAETAGQLRRLPGLYLSLAQWRLDGGETGAAEDLLRKSIRGATTADLKETHAKARVALGDIAHAGGDLATACEHWQIARALFRELHQGREHDAVDTRMQRNGCPTDWVLTDF